MHRKPKGMIGSLTEFFLNKSRIVRIEWYVKLPSSNLCPFNYVLSLSLSLFYARIYCSVPWLLVVQIIWMVCQLMGSHVKVLRLSSGSH